MQLWEVCTGSLEAVRCSRDEDVLIGERTPVRRRTATPLGGSTRKASPLRASALEVSRLTPRCAPKLALLSPWRVCFTRMSAPFPPSLLAPSSASAADSDAGAALAGCFASTCT